MMCTEKHIGPEIDSDKQPWGRFMYICVFVNDAITMVNGNIFILSSETQTFRSSTYTMKYECFKSVLNMQ